MSSSSLTLFNNWIYPNNYPIRKYQQNIVFKSLFLNTLICLPTGMGKTLIASVIMYNYYRWYPNGKIIFLAPTKPLVSQQMLACSNIVGITLNDISIFDGTCNIITREKEWLNKRVFFCTPQVLFTFFLICFYFHYFITLFLLLHLDC